MPTEAPSSAHAFTASMVVHFVSAVREVFSTMLGGTISVATPHRKNTPSPSYDVSAIIGISGQVVGSMVLCFDLETAGKVVNALSGTNIPPDHPDFPDAVGEITNMIAGSAKKNFGASASISVPSVVVGGGHRLAKLHDLPCIVLPCNCEFGRFAIEISVKSNIQNTQPKES
jgi:chemotaxis protein CheX